MEGEVQMNELLKKDFTMKIISVLIAVILWFMVLDQSNPYETKTFSITLDVKNKEALLDKNIVLKNQDDIYSQEVEIKLGGRHDRINNITKNDFKAELDLSKITNSGMTSLEIKGPLYTGKQSISDVTYDIDPRSVDLVLDSVEKNVFHVDTETGGSLKEKYSIISIKTTPESLTLQDEDSLLQTVGSIKAIIDVTDLDKDLDIKQECSIFDKNNKNITKLFNVQTVNAKITVAKEVSIKPIISGTPAPNFLNISNITSPQKVKITGPYDLISKLEELTTAPISIENQNQNAIITSALILPQGVTLVDTPSEVTVSLAIEPLAKKSFVISRSDISVLNPEKDNSLKYDILSNDVTIEIKGPKYELEKLSLSNLLPSIDVSRIVEGNFQLPLMLELPDSVGLVQDYKVQVLIGRR